MSFEPENVEGATNTEAQLEEIIKLLKLIALRIEEAYETKIEEEDMV